MIHLVRSPVAAPAIHTNCSETHGGDVEATQPIDRLNMKVLKCSTATEQALHVVVGDADGDELKVRQSR